MKIGVAARCASPLRNCQKSPREKAQNHSSKNSEDILPPIATAISLYDMREKTNYAQQKNCNTKPTRKKAQSKHAPDITRSSDFALTINNAHHNYSTNTKENAQYRYLQ